MKPSIKIFSASDMNDVSNMVNGWLESLDYAHNRVIDIKMSSTVRTFDVLVYIETTM